jgi:hypothetical protein
MYSISRRSSEPVSALLRSVKWTKSTTCHWRPAPAPRCPTPSNTFRIPATFIYAGINVERGGLFSGTRGQQIAGRFSLITTAFPYLDEWKGLVGTLEGSLRLRNHRPGTLTALDGYLHQRTGGMIGSLSHLIRGAAIEAILDGTETITKHLLDAVELDHAAQHRTPERPAKRTG